MAILHFVQVMVFGNYFLLQTEDIQTAIRELLVHLLCDEQLEVGSRHILVVVLCVVC